MTARYEERYLARVVDDQDPLQEHRLLVEVPALLLTPAWARASLPPTDGDAAPPGVDATVVVTFEAGNVDYPVWEVDGDLSSARDPRHAAKHLGQVIDDADPLGEGRVGVVVPSGDPSPAWAVYAVPGGADRLPAVGESVWIEYPEGDLSRPVWVGLA